MSERIHLFAEKGFQSSTAAYDRGRPEYPVEALDFFIQELGLDSMKKVVDLGAGTGKLTKLLAKIQAELIGIEPVEGMRRKFSENLPEVPILDGTAEQIPLATQSVDAVIVAQAFHWFRGAEALAEIHRVLKPNGSLALIWNVRDENVDWVAELTKLIDPHEKGTPRYRSGEWKKAIQVTTLFLPLRTFHFTSIQPSDHQMIVDRIASISFIAALELQEKQKVLGQVGRLLETHPQTKNKAQIEFPYRTDLFLCEKI